MRKRALVLVGLVTVTACVGSPLLEKPTTTAATGSIPPTSDPSTTEVPGPIRGALPDGTIYDIAFPTPRAESVGEIQAGLVLEHDGTKAPLLLSFRRDSPEATAGISFRAGDWTVQIQVPDSLDAESRDLVERSIEVSTEVEMPVLELEPPLRWSGPPQIDYETFVVRSGCPAEAMACNPTQAVSVIPQEGETLETPISVQSYALRPRFDPHYLPPGPLTARWSPDVLWTGKEMVVWGGSPSPGPSQLIDGAAYDPNSNEWRMLPSPPLAGEQATRAIWVGTEMVVIGEEATVAWDPDDDLWRVVARGINPPLDPGMTVATGSDVITWSSEGLHRPRADGEWELIDDPGVGAPGLYDGGVLRVVRSTLFAIGHDDCDRLVRRLHGDQWSAPTRISLGASPPACGNPNQTAVVDDGLVIWDDTSAGTISYDPASGSVDQLPDFPLPATEHAPGSLQLDGAFLVASGLEGALFEASDGRWTTTELPGLGTDVDMVWTGEQVLAWAQCCYGPGDIDAWRWTPPSR
jgi:hypothetical protein